MPVSHTQIAQFLVDMDTPGSPDMLSIGQNCAVKSCRQLDFLPFTCDACQEVFCLEHRQYQSHKCSKAGRKETTAIVCPLCARAIKLSPDEDPNVAFERHTAEACDPQNYAKVHRKARCPCPGCREKLTTINTYRCKVCALEVCLKHRFPGDHNCPGRVPAPQANPLATAMRGLLGLGSSSAAKAAQPGGANGTQRRVQTAGPAKSRAAPAQTAEQAAAAAPMWPAAAAAGRAAATAALRRLDLTGAREPEQEQQQDGQQGAVSVPERCSQCGEGFATLQELVFHVDAFHPSNPAAGDGNAGGGPPEHCPHCSQAFRDAVELVAHVERSHSGLSFRRKWLSWAIPL